MKKENIEIKSTEKKAKHYTLIDNQYMPSNMIETTEHVKDWIKKDIRELSNTLAEIENEEDWEGNLEIMSNSAYRLNQYINKLRRML